VVAIASDSLQNAQDAVQRLRIPFPCLVDENHLVYDRYDVQSKLISLGQRPALFIVDMDGIVQYAHLGTQQWHIPETAQVLEGLDQINASRAARSEQDLDSSPGSSTIDG